MFDIRRTHLLAAPAIAVAACLAALPAAAQNCEVKIGSAGSTSGPAAAWGLGNKAGVDFVAALVNSEGGLAMGNGKCKVTVLSYDTQYTSAGGAAASNYFASEGVTAIVGPTAASPTTGFNPVANRHGQVSFNSTFALDAIGKDHPRAFHQLQGPAAWGPEVTKAALQHVKFSTIMIVGPNDQAGTDVAKQLKPIFESFSIKTMEEYYQRGSTNFSPLAQRILMAKPAAVELSAVPPGDAIVLVRALLEAGYDGVLASYNFAGPSYVIQGAGGIEKLKAFIWAELAPSDDPGTARLRADFQRVMKAPAPENQLFYSGVFATEQMLRAISAAGTDKDGEKIAAALRKLTPESRYVGKGGWRGKTQFGVNQELAFPVGMGVIADGKKVGVKRIDVPAEH